MYNPISQTEHLKTDYVIPVSEELELKPVPVESAQRLFHLVDQDREYLGKWLPWVEFTDIEDDSRMYLERAIYKRSKGQEYGFGIYVMSKLAGHISLMNVKDRFRNPEIGYWIGQDYAGRGYTTEAARAITTFGFETLGLNKIVIRAEPENIASNKVAEKIGYTLTKRLIDQDSHRLYNVWVHEKNK